MIENNKYSEKIYIETILYGLYSALIPLNMILNFSGNATINKYIGLGAGFLGAWRIIARHKFKIEKYYLGYIVLLFYMLFEFLRSPEYRLSQLITLLSLVFIFMIFSVRGFNEREYNYVLFMTTIVSASIVFFLAPNVNISYSRGTLTTTAGSADSNSLAANMLFGFLLAFHMFLSSKTGIKRKIIYSICMILIGLGVILTGSRGAILTLAISILAYLLIRRKNIDENSGVIKLFILGMLFILGGYYLFTEYIDQAILNRFQITSIFADGGSGRAELWRYYYAEAQDSLIHFLFGHGFGTALNAHNVFIEYFYSTGIVGVLIILILLGIVVYRAFLLKDNLAMGFIWIVIITSCTIGYFLNKGFWNGLLLAISSMNIKIIKTEEKENARFYN